LRSVILVVATAFVLAMGGLVYFWNSGRGHHEAMRQSADSINIPTPRQADPALRITEGDHASVKKYDPATGDLASEYLAEEYIPRRGGLVDVKNAIARFYLAHGQIIELHGDSGQFRTDTPQSKSKGLTQERVATPNRGRLKNVTITVIDTVGDPAHPTTQTSMTIKTDNAAFDTENANVVTEAYIDPQTGATVAADQVPVALRSPDTNPNGYDFDGKGLKMQWNERDHRLTSLDIAHGERLVIKNPKNMSTEPATDAPKPQIASSRPVTQPIAVTQPVETASDVTEDVAEPEKAFPSTMPTTGRATTRYAVGRRGRRRVYEPPPPTIPKLTPNLEPPIYRAEFHNAVRIVQNGETMATADLMLVDFWMQDNNDASANASNAQSTGHRVHPYGTTNPDQPTTGPAVIAPEPAPLPPPAPTTVATSQPATKPSEAPVYVYWTGPLHVAPHSEAPVAVHKEIVTLIGEPVVAQQKNSQMKASKMIYNTDDGSLKAVSPGMKNVLLTSADPHGESIIHTTTLDYFSRALPPTAVLSGPSTAKLPTEGNGGVLNASWLERCTLRMQNMPDNGTEIKEADLTGQVHIDHPQLQLDSQRLELFFVPSATTKPAKTVATTEPVPATEPTSQPTVQTNLKQLVASDNVHCVMFDSQHKAQTIDTDRLTVLTEPGADGKLSPRTVNADGDVHAVNEEQDLTGEHLAAQLMPATRPATTRRAVASATEPSTQPDGAFSQAVDIQSLIVQGHVHVKGLKDNSEAKADTMLIDNVNGKKTVKFVGQPTAEVITKTNHIFGPIIDLASDDQQMAIDGPGHMMGVQQDGPTTRPMDVTWTQSMRGDGKTNIVNAYGNVLAQTVDAEGRVSAVRSEQAQLLLADAPTTQPATRPTTQVAAATHPATTGPTSKPGADEAMAKKTIKQAIFKDNAHVSSTLLDAQGLILQRMNLYSSIVIYDVLPALPGAPPGATMKRVTVPVPGTMLVEDYRPQAAHQAADDSSPLGTAGSRGATAFKWQKSMVYDDSTHQAVMEKDVIVNHMDNINKDNSMHLTADTVIADLESAPPTLVTKTAATQATSKPMTKPDPGPHLRHVTAKGHVHVDMKDGELVAEWIEYDPLTRVMIAHGTPDVDAVFTRALATAGGTQPMRGQILQWDAAQDLPTIVQGAAEMRR
jgi:hypothetical protein